MRLKFLRLLFCALLLLSTTFVTVAQAQTGEGGGSAAQSPVQVVVQIIVTAIVLRVLNTFDLP